MQLFFVGGAARALAYAGLLHAFEERGVEVTGVQGSSGGAVIAALRAFQSLDQAEAVFAAIAQVLQRRRLAILFKRRIQAEQLAAVYARFLPGTMLEDAALPLGVTAWNLNASRHEVLETGSVSTALAASSALPGLVRPVELGGARWLDWPVAPPLSWARSFEGSPQRRVVFITHGEDAPQPGDRRPYPWERWLGIDGFLDAAVSAKQALLAQQSDIHLIQVPNSRAFSKDTFQTAFQAGYEFGRRFSLQPSGAR